MNKIYRVLVVDDSALVRQVLTDGLNEHPQIEVVATAQDGKFVLSKIEKYSPDVVTLDIEMKMISGLDILPQIISKFHLPVIMVSGHTQRGAESTIRALELGAVDFVSKPDSSGFGSVNEIIESLTQKIIAVGGKTIRDQQKYKSSATVSPSIRIPAENKIQTNSKIKLSTDIIAIGASTGGTEAIKDVLVPLPNTLPGIVIVQHMPPTFTKAFADRLNSLSSIHVKEAKDNDPVMTGTALIAPGGYHLQIVKKGLGYYVQILNTPPVNHHRPSVDVLFHSAAQTAGKRCLGIILTGMGGDGAEGMKCMHDKGSFTIAQDEQSCVVFGMPKEAIKKGGVDQIFPLTEIPQFLISQFCISHNQKYGKIAYA